MFQKNRLYGFVCNWMDFMDYIGLNGKKVLILLTFLSKGMNTRVILNIKLKLTLNILSNWGSYIMNSLFYQKK